MTNLIAIAVLALIVGLAAGYVYRTKKNGAKCIGCPMARECSGKCSCREEM